MMIFLLFVFFSFHFIFPLYKKNTRPVKESLRSCTAIKWRSSSRAAFKKGLPTVIRLFFSFSTKEDRLILLKGIREKDTQMARERERESRKKPCGCELCSFYTIPGGWPVRTNFIMHIHFVRSFELFLLEMELESRKPARPKQPLSLHFDDSLLSKRIFLRFNFTFISNSREAVTSRSVDWTQPVL